MPIKSGKVVRVDDETTNIILEIESTFEKQKREMKGAELFKMVENYIFDFRRLSKGARPDFVLVDIDFRNRLCEYMALELKQYLINIDAVMIHGIPVLFTFQSKHKKGPVDVVCLKNDFPRFMPGEFVTVTIDNFKHDKNG